MENEKCSCACLAWRGNRGNGPVWHCTKCGAEYELDRLSCRDCSYKEFARKEKEKGNSGMLMQEIATLKADNNWLRGQIPIERERMEQQIASLQKDLADARGVAESHLQELEAAGEKNTVLEKQNDHLQRLHICDEMQAEMYSDVILGLLKHFQDFVMRSKD